jgi:hypothetical protein
MPAETPQQEVDRINRGAEAERSPEGPGPITVRGALPLIAFGIGGLVVAALAVWLIFRDVH